MPDVHAADGQVFPVKPEIAAKAHITAARYQDMFERAARDPDGFWAEQSRRIAWMKAPTRIKNTSFAGDVSIKWFEDGTLNASASCLDRHLATRGDQTAIIWESDDPVGVEACHLPRTARAGVPPGQRDEGPRREEGRPGHDLSADGAGGRGGDAGLRADRRDPLRGVRRVLARQPGQPHPGLRLRTADHRRRRPPRRAQGAAEGERRRGAEDLPRA